MFLRVGGSCRLRCQSYRLLNGPLLQSGQLRSPLQHTLVFYTTSTPAPRAPHRSRGHKSVLTPRTPDSFHPQAHPARQAKKSRSQFLQRTSLMDQLQNVEDVENGHNTESNAARSTSSTALVSSSTHQAVESDSATSPYVTSPHLISAQRQAEANAADAASYRVHRRAQQSASSANGVEAAAASAQLQDQQRALRDAFTHARQHHNVRLAKDPRLYRAECRAFRQAHQGRAPTAQEVSRTVAVPLAPVSALKTLAHTNARTSTLHSATAEALLLHNAVVKNELVRSNAPQLVRCLRCFHVYTGRPRTLWGGEVEQSGIEYEKAQAQQAADRQLQRRPWLRKHIGSVGRRQRAQQENPTCCPQCGSPRAQWMMEYVHHHTHEKT